jgi:hypothetical protein
MPASLYELVVVHAVMATVFFIAAVFASCPVFS